jgi:hypothetical protein
MRCRKRSRRTPLLRTNAAGEATDRDHKVPGRVL